MPEPTWKRPALLMALLLGGACTSTPPGEAPAPPPAPLATTAQPVELETASALEDALDLYTRTRNEQVGIAIDFGERRGRLISPYRLLDFTEPGDFDTVFILADEAFEGESDAEMGVGQAPIPTGQPPPPRRIQTGELGGLDSASCRSCHFLGGPDGAGAFTQVALFRGDGQRLSSASLRDAPHVMGLGYIELAADQMTAQLQSQLHSMQDAAANLNAPVEGTLYANRANLGTIRVFPDRTYDTSQLRGVSEDLIVRPFGHKGRHARLTALVDEALQLHHGLQSTSRMERFADQAPAYLGPGPVNDPDADGQREEVTEAHPILLASYLSMLAIPEFRVPTDPELALAWARGQRVFRDVGCASCHLEQLELAPDSLVVTHRAEGVSDLSVTFDLEVFGIEPRPRRLDFGVGPDGTSPSTIPLYPFTDLLRHDMGPDLAEPVAEHLPGTDGLSVPGNVWLTRSLWGLADTAPYLHDGRAPTIHDAILAHGGEAEAARNAYAEASEEDRAALRVFLTSLSRSGTVLVE